MIIKKDSCQKYGAGMHRIDSCPIQEVRQIISCFHRQGIH
ncbi:hypothetical Protein YC6258_05144 [Gynuella sunshinyii YC6258]|uniref:Uncharacterized protein n=1 Tax=Gynuella sunshinyii YC6258 TaxID=1445510 RepID=A0A0C5W3G6_9GAMM|nr:hypothetical Protein YC6258_05144 [Gynuella sunshinyii YC6258]